MGLQENQRGKQKKEIGKKIFLLALVVFTGGFLFNQLQKKYYELQLSKLKFGNSYIQDFLIVGKNKGRFIIRGNSLIDEGKSLKIENFLLSYIKSKEDILNVKSKEAVFLKEKDILKLEGDVNFLTKNLSIRTPKVDIFIKEKIAKNNSDVEIKSKMFNTKGKNLYINLINEEIHLTNVKSVIRGI